MHDSLVRLAAVLLVIGCSMPGCGTRLGFAGSGGSVRAESLTTGNSIQPRLRTTAYVDRGKGEADVYMTDLTPEQLAEGTPFDELSGSVVHIRLFLKPRAGRTPIEETASSAIVRHMVLARGSIGIYGGGAFVFQRGDAGDRSVGGSLAGASMRLVRSTPDFADQLGAAEMLGSFNAIMDTQTAGMLEALLADAKSYTRPVEPLLIDEAALADLGP